MNSRNVLKCCYAHYLHVLDHKEYFITEKTIDAVRYMNYSVHANQLRLTELFFRQLKKINKPNTVFLNISTGPGFLETFNKNNRYTLNLSSAEFQSQINCYEAIRTYNNVDQINYICTDFNSENFEIIKCKTHFNYVILKDFVSFWKLDDLKSALLKFKIYARRIVLLEKDANLTSLQQDYLNLKSYETINIMEDWKMYSIKIKSLDENI